jgi:hypothetical protein
LINRLKPWRRVATGSEMRAANDEAILPIAAILLWTTQRRAGRPGVSERPPVTCLAVSVPVMRRRGGCRRTRLMRPILVLVAAVAVVAFAVAAGAPSGALSGSATTAALPAAPDPSECRVAPRPIEDFVAPRPKGGRVPRDAAALGRARSEAELPASLNAGDLHRATALLTDDVLRAVLVLWELDPADFLDGWPGPATQSATSAPATLGPS